jgi:hypothetical protein
MKIHNNLCETNKNAKSEENRSETNYLNCFSNIFIYLHLLCVLSARYNFSAQSIIYLALNGKIVEELKKLTEQYLKMLNYYLI